MTETHNDSPIDYIFGELDQPQNAARWEKERLIGVHHYARKTPDAPLPCKPVTLKVTTDSSQTYDAIFVWYTTDNWLSTHKLACEKGQLNWNSIAWRYLQEWQVTLPPQLEGVMLRYKIGVRIQGLERIVYAENQSPYFDGATNYSIWYGKQNYPRWAKQAIVYQIFVDRFNPGNGKQWVQTADLRKHFGGTLNGVTEKLPYLKSLGFNAIWLTPIFDSPSHHGYDTSDYFKINPNFGTLEEFRKLISESHRLGIRIILDFVANHCSSNHPYFKDAIENKNSAYHDWFVWSEWPKYESFFNVGNMPKLNLSFGSQAREHLLDAAKYWLEMGVDGYRLDYAHGTEHDFWVDFRRVCSSVNPDLWTFGELVLPADIQASYADGLGGTLDFLLCQVMRFTFANEAWDLSRFAGFIANHFNYFSSEHSLPSFIDNHDMDRFFTIADDNVNRLRLALLVLYVLPSPPIIYYGTELPLSQRRLIHAGGGLGFDEARLEMAWSDKEQANLGSYLFSLAQMREKLHKYSDLKWQVDFVDDEEQILVMRTEDDKFLLLINRSKTDKNIPLARNYTVGKWGDVLTGEAHFIRDGKLNIRIPSMSGVVLSTDEIL